MKRWEDFLKEEPPDNVSAAVQARVETEMKTLRGSRRWWLQLAGVSLALAAVMGGYRLVVRRDPTLPGEEMFLDLADDEALDLETLEDLDVIEILEELDEWQNG